VSSRNSIVFFVTQSFAEFFLIFQSASDGVNLCPIPVFIPSLKFFLCAIPLVIPWCLGAFLAKYPATKALWHKGAQSLFFASYEVEDISKV